MQIKNLSLRPLHAAWEDIDWSEVREEFSLQRLLDG